MLATNPTQQRSSNASSNQEATATKKLSDGQGIAITVMRTMEDLPIEEKKELSDSGDTDICGESSSSPEPRDGSVQKDSAANMANQQQ